MPCADLFAEIPVGDSTIYLAVSSSFYYKKDILWWSCNICKVMDIISFLDIICGMVGILAAHFDIQDIHVSMIILNTIFGYFWTKNLASENEREILEFLTGAPILCIGVLKLNYDKKLLLMTIIICSLQNLFTLFLNNRPKDFCYYCSFRWITHIQCVHSYVIHLSYEIQSMVKIPKMA